MKLLQKGTQITWTVDNLLKEGFIKVGSKTYEEYWKHTKTDDILTLSVVESKEEFEGLSQYLEEAQQQAVCDYFSGYILREGLCFTVAKSKKHKHQLHLVSYDEWDNNPDEVIDQYWSGSLDETISWCDKMCKSWN